MLATFIGTVYHRHFSEIDYRRVPSSTVYCLKITRRCLYVYCLVFMIYGIVSRFVVCLWPWYGAPTCVFFCFWLNFTCALSSDCTECMILIRFCLSVLVSAIHIPFPIFWTYMDIISFVDSPSLCVCFFVLNSCLPERSICIDNITVNKTSKEEPDADNIKPK